MIILEPSQREIRDVYDEVTIDTVVRTMDGKNHLTFPQRLHSYDINKHKRFTFSEKDMMASTDFQNQKQGSAAVLEMIDLTQGNLDERNPKTFSTWSTNYGWYPFFKTKDGILHLDEMPWDAKKQRNYSFLIGGALLAVAGIV